MSLNTSSLKSRAVIPIQRQAITAAAPIGVFDSGIGGLSVAQEIALHLPQEQILYYADTLHVPYGCRSDDNIRELTAQAIDWLYHQGCKAAVVACNTASAFSLDYLREHYGSQFPIIGLVPALKPAVLHSRSKVVAVLATEATFRGQLIRDVLRNFAQPAGVKVIPVICHDLVPLIEAGLANSVQCHQVLQACLQDAVAAGADELVLGCTHYPFLKAALQQVYPQLHLLDSGVAVARQTARVLLQHALKKQHVSTTQQASTKQHLLNNQSLSVAVNTQMLMPSSPATVEPLAPSTTRLNPCPEAAKTVQLDCVLSGNNADFLQPILTQLISRKITWRVRNLHV